MTLAKKQAASEREAMKALRESEIQRLILDMLHKHPAVVWAERMNSGVATIKGFRVKFGFTGCPDIMGQMRDGRFIGIEVKATGKQPTVAQSLFLSLAKRNGAVCGVARSVEDALQLLGPA